MLEIQDIRRNWQARGFSCDCWTDPKGQVWSNYVHNTDELLMVIEGCLSLQIGANTYQALPGQEYFIPAYSVHSVSNLADGPSRWLYGYKDQF